MYTNMPVFLENLYMPSKGHVSYSPFTIWAITETLDLDILDLAFHQLQPFEALMK